MDMAGRGSTASRRRDFLLQQFPDARVVIVTDYADDVVREAAAGAGACEFMRKDTWPSSMRSCSRGSIS